MHLPHFREPRALIALTISINPKSYFYTIS